MKTSEVVAALENGVKLTRKPYQYEGYYSLKEGSLWFHMKNSMMNNDPAQLLLNDWVEFKESKFTKGDKVVNKLSGKLHKIQKVLVNDQYMSEDSTTLHEKNLRLATIEDIEYDEQRITWLKWDRVIDEYRVGDIVDFEGRIKEITCVMGNNYGFMYCNQTKFVSPIYLKMICPVENRVDKSK